ncbi:MAG: hypothetical protein PHC33_02360 [Candidatus Omnitrophica bacterium]|nr:hypothetical protein [Candidatus Omnitrophota bacterium]
MTKKREKRKIERELPSVGTVLNGKFKGVGGYKAVIVKADSASSGKAIKCNGKIYTSMTAAAQSITNQPTNGWRFWRF